MKKVTVFLCVLLSVFFCMSCHKSGSSNSAVLPDTTASYNDYWGLSTSFDTTLQGFTQLVGVSAASLKTALGNPSNYLNYGDTAFYFKLYLKDIHNNNKYFRVTAFRDKTGKIGTYTLVAIGTKGDAVEIKKIAVSVADTLTAHGYTGWKYYSYYYTSGITLQPNFDSAWNAYITTINYFAYKIIYQNVSNAYVAEMRLPADIPSNFILKFYLSQ